MKMLDEPTDDFAPPDSASDAEPMQESLTEATNLDNWTQGQDLVKTLARLEAEVAQACADEDSRYAVARQSILPYLSKLPGAVPNAGFYGPVPVEEIERTQRGLLFNRGVEACDGTIAVHDTLPLTVMQIGVCTAGYDGNSGTYVHQIYQRDLRSHNTDPVSELLDLLERRAQQSGIGQERGEKNQDEPRSVLAGRGIMAYAERAILLEKSKANWRMGHGHPIPYELMSGFWAGREEWQLKGLALLRNLVRHKKFIFVPSAPGDRHLLTIGNALRPLEYALVWTVEAGLFRQIENGNARRNFLVRQKDFVSEVGPQIVTGVFRVSEAAPATLFYAHVEHAHMAARIAMADAALQMHRGFPMLIDLADKLCTAHFSASSFVATVQEAYTGAGAPFRFLGERETRR